MSVMGIDVGTYSTKGVLVSDDGHVLAEAVRPHGMIVPRPGWAEHDPEATWWGEVASVSRALLAGHDAGAVRCVALSAIGPCLVALDAGARPIGPGILYGVDTRATAEIADLNRSMGVEAILRDTGNALTTQAVGPKLLWLRRNLPDAYARAAAFGTSTTLMVARLTGEVVMDHYTAGSWTPLYDVERRAWRDLPDIVDRARLPRLMWTGEVAGHVTDAAARETGLAPGTPVTCGTVDAAAEAVSVGVAAPGDTMVMMGSTVFTIQVARDRLAHPALWSAPWLEPGTWALMAGQATSGTLTHWFRDHLGGGADFAALAGEAAAVPPGAEGLLFLPYFSGERTPIQDPLAKGAWFGLTLAHGRGHLYRALLEGVAMGTAHIVDTYSAAGAEPARVLAVGGGVANGVWLQATADLVGLPHLLCRSSTGAALGDAMLAARAAGLDPSGWNPVERAVEPEARDAYARLYPLWKDLYEATRGIAHALG